MSSLNSPFNILLYVRALQSQQELYANGFAEGKRVFHR